MNRGLDGCRGRQASRPLGLLLRKRNDGRRDDLALSGVAVGTGTGAGAGADTSVETAAVSSVPECASEEGPVSTITAARTAGSSGRTRRRMSWDTNVITWG